MPAILRDATLSYIAGARFIGPGIFRRSSSPQCLAYVSFSFKGHVQNKHNRSSFRKERNRPRWGRSLAMLLLTSPQFFMPPTASHAALHLLRFLAAQLRNIAPALHLSWSPNYILDNSNRCCKILPRDWHSWQDTCDHSRVERFCSTRTRLAQTWTSSTGNPGKFIFLEYNLLSVVEF